MLPISVVIPVWNRQELVKRAIESALRQTYPPAEIVVVDDGSTDETAVVVRAYADRVRYVFQTNKGAAAARNLGVETAVSPWIAFLDSDDYWHEDHLTHIAAAIQATNGRARFYFADTIRPPNEPQHRQWERASFHINEPHCYVDDATEWVLMRIQPMMLQSTVFRRDAYLESGGCWPRLHTREDTHLFLKLGLGGAACAVNSIGAIMTATANEQRLTASHAPLAQDGRWMQVWLYRDILRRFSHLPAAHRQVLQRRLASAYWGLARVYWYRRQPITAVLRAMHSFSLDPVGFWQRINRARHRVV